MTDPFLHDDAPYVLGALDAEDRRAFEAHLQTCADCRARVAELRGPAAALATVPLDADPGPQEPVPDTLLPGLLRRAAAERRRRHLVTASIAAVAAALVVALTVIAWPGGSSSSGTSRPPGQALVALHPSPLKVTARLTAKAWGTKIDLHCEYPANEQERFAYDLVVIDGTNRRHVAGDWTLVPGKNGVDFTTGTSVPRGQIRVLQVRTSTGTPLLQLKL